LDCYFCGGPMTKKHRVETERFVRVLWTAQSVLLSIGKLYGDDEHEGSRPPGSASNDGTDRFEGALVWKVHLSFRLHQRSDSFQLAAQLAFRPVVDFGGYAAHGVFLKNDASLLEHVRKNRRGRHANVA